MALLINIKITKIFMNFSKFSKQSFNIFTKVFRYYLGLKWQNIQTT